MYGGGGQVLVLVQYLVPVQDAPLPKSVIQVIFFANNVLFAKIIT